MIESIYRGSILQSSIYTYTQTDHVIEVGEYDFEKEEWAEKQTFHSEQAKTSDNEPYIQINEWKNIYYFFNKQRVYLVNWRFKNRKVFI